MANTGKLCSNKPIQYVYIYTHKCTYLLHIITYYYILFYTITYYYILLHMIAYYYILLYIIALILSSHVCDCIQKNHRCPPLPLRPKSSEHLHLSSSFLRDTRGDLKKKNHWILQMVYTYVIFQMIKIHLFSRSGLPLCHYEKL